MRWLPAILLVSVANTVAPVALAQGGDVDFSQIQDVARAKAEEGLALYEAGEWAEAFERFRIAEDLFHAPTLVLFMGNCQRELGDLLRARDLYRRVANEELPEDAPEAFRAAVTSAAEQLQGLDARIPTLTLTVEGVPVDRARVRVDGSEVDLSAQPLALNPGSHRIVATAPGATAIERDVALDEGAREEVALSFEKVKVAPAPPVSPVPSTSVEQEPGSILPAMIAAGVGVTGFVVGGVAGGLVLSRVSDIKEECDGDVCPERLQGEADDAQILATVSNVGLVVGGIGAAVAITFVFWRPWAGNGAALEAGVSPTGLMLRGRF
ncbi:MAG TPA: hypothetical protein ENK57_22415 [Polyangiaceae bacterium]|nr:hypothetical protein [Polyangiaceae bacterium]